MQVQAALRVEGSIAVTTGDFLCHFWGSLGEGVYGSYFGPDFTKDLGLCCDVWVSGSLACELPESS